VPPPRVPGDLTCPCSSPEAVPHRFYDDDVMMTPLPRQEAVGKSPSEDSEADAVPTWHPSMTPPPLDGDGDASGREEEEEEEMMEEQQEESHEAWKTSADQATQAELVSNFCELTIAAQLIVQPILPLPYDSAPDSVQDGMLLRTTASLMMERLLGFE
jgi:hypothetical protein